MPYESWLLSCYTHIILNICTYLLNKFYIESHISSNCCTSRSKNKFLHLHNHCFAQQVSKNTHFHQLNIAEMDLRTQRSRPRTKYTIFLNFSKLWSANFSCFLNAKVFKFCIFFRAFSPIFEKWKKILKICSPLPKGEKMPLCFDFSAKENQN